MIILDTDIISMLDRKSGEPFQKLAHRLAAVPDEERVCSTIISFEEHMRGWLAQIASAGKPEAQVVAYRRLQRLLQEFNLRDVLPFDTAAAEIFTTLQRRKIRIGTMDLRIGCGSHRGQISSNLIKQAAAMLPDARRWDGEDCDRGS